MLPTDGPFEADYDGSDIVYGRGSVDRLGERFADRGWDDALVVCGSNVWANEALSRSVRRGLGDRLAGVFDETTPEKSADTVFDGIDRMEAVDPDVLVGIGGGSSLDVARQMSAFAADGRPLSAFREAARAGRSPSPSADGSLAPVVVIPTTFAGADISSGGVVEVLPAEASPTGQPVTAGGPVLPAMMVYDPALFETTPTGAIAGSAMNGFDKGIETPYARDGTPISDATAVHGLRFLADALPTIGDDDPAAMERAVIGLILVQYDRKISVVHAFGHGFSRRYSVQQGVIHGVLVPHVLRYLFGEVDANRRAIAEGLGVGDDASTDAELAEAIVEEVTAIRDSLGLPTRLRDVEAVDERDIPAIAEFVRDDYMMDRAPAGLDPTAEEIEGVLRAAW